MRLHADQELAMVLPIPVKSAAPENDVEFIDLKGYPNLFADLQKGFKTPKNPYDGTRAKTAALSAETLEVHSVGEFEASFVPTIKAFSRLDKRFQLPEGTWEKLPQYKDYGFTVFKLKPGAKTVHPMAFSFSRADVTKLFFPTVHIHDGEVHSKAEFDHVLFAQPRTNQQLDLRGWEESETPAMNFVDTKRAKGVIAANDHCYRMPMHGMLTNADTWLDVMA